MTKIKIGQNYIGENYPCFIIAEAGVNHNGRLSLAKKLIDKAKLAGANAVKFQAFKTEALVNINAPKASYQQRSVPKLSQFQMLKKLELQESDFKVLLSYAKEKNIIFLCSCFDPESAELVNKLKIPAFKIGSGELTNLPLLEQIARFGKPLIVSTGMSTLSEIKKAVKTIKSTGNRSIILLHCTSNYPTQYKDVNLAVLETLKKEFKVPVGYSDHTEGISVAIAARALGAAVIEKHFTLDKKMSGPDHRASAEPAELEKMVQAIRLIDLALGSKEKKPQKSERQMRQVARRSIVAAADILKDEIIKAEMLSIKRPGTGIGPENWKKVVGRRARKNIKKETVLSWKEIK